MAYDAIVHGAHAILYWGTHAIEKDSSLWQDMMKVARELRALEPAIVAEPATVEPRARAEETYGSIDGQGPTLMLRRTGNDWHSFPGARAIPRFIFSTPFPAGFNG